MQRQKSKYFGSDSRKQALCQTQFSVGYIELFKSSHDKTIKTKVMNTSCHQAYKTKRWKKASVF